MEIIREPNSQVVKLVALFEIGRLEESKKGLAQSVSSMMKKSTKYKNNEELQIALDRYGINIEINSSPLYLSAEMHCHKKFFKQSIPLFFEILFESKFDEHIWEIVRSQTIESILQNQNQTDFWADKLLSEHIFGANHPLGYYSEPKDYLSITLTDIEDFYSKYIQITKPSFFIAGDVDENVETDIIQALEIYPLETSPINKSIKFNLSTPQVLTKTLAETNQASISLGKIFPRDSFDNFMQLELFSTFLGGYFTSELMRLLRIELGYTYGVYSYLIHFPKFSFFQITYETDASNVEASLDAINNLFNRLNSTEKIDFKESRMQYFSQWSKNAERSLQEIMYKIRLKRLGYDYRDYKSIVENYSGEIALDLNHYTSAFLDFSSYSKSIVS